MIKWPTDICLIQLHSLWASFEEWKLAWVTPLAQDQLASISCLMSHLGHHIQCPRQFYQYFIFSLHSSSLAILHHYHQAKVKPSTGEYDFAWWWPRSCFTRWITYVLFLIQATKHNYEYQFRFFLYNGGLSECETSLRSASIMSTLVLQYQLGLKEILQRSHTTLYILIRKISCTIMQKSHASHLPGWSKKILTRLPSSEDCWEVRVMVPLKGLAFIFLCGTIPECSGFFSFYFIF